MAPDLTDLLIDLPPDDEDNAGRQVDAATLVAAQIFGSPALPKGIPAAKAEFIIAAANAAQRLDTNGLTIGGAFGGPLGEPTREERHRQLEEDALDYLSDAAERAEHARELERDSEVNRRGWFVGILIAGQRSGSNFVLLAMVMQKILS